ncbi:hypothetical protein EVG20_g10218 [Dentipellis fragilis]|uniref:Uncharacterized protein n=1 Tax=Dentipellis fragilis TaxID=205917 RepID=A0A4Y9XT33_9AGAM|nr:hypothetical protein EVG20_g10218 [Dentipellis fragilis]
MPHGFCQGCSKHYAYLKVPKCGRCRDRESNEAELRSSYTQCPSCGDTYPFLDRNSICGQCSAHDRGAGFAVQDALTRLPNPKAQPHHALPTVPQTGAGMPNMNAADRLRREAETTLYSMEAKHRYSVLEHGGNTQAVQKGKVRSAAAVAGSISKNDDILADAKNLEGLRD